MPTWSSRLIHTGRMAVSTLRDRHVPFASIAEIRSLQSRRVRTIVRHAYRTVPFYRHAMDELGIKPEELRSADDLSRLPLIDSEVVRSDPLAFVSSDARKMPCIKLHSSGSQSSVRNTVYWDGTSILQGLVYGERDRRVLRAYLQNRSDAWTGDRISMLRNRSATIAANRFRRDHLLLPGKVLPTHMVPPTQPIEDVVRQINAIRPAVVFSYGS